MSSRAARLVALPARRRTRLVEQRRVRRRAVAGHRRAVHHALVTRAVPAAAAMEHTAVVPHHEIAGTPAVLVDAVGPRGELEQLRDQDAARVQLEALDVPGVRADVDRLVAVPGIGADERVTHGRIVATYLGTDARVDQAARETEAVNDDLAVDVAPQVIGQGLVGHPHARELGLAALGRNDARGQ